jgi:tryptophan halogenase
VSNRPRHVVIVGRDAELWLSAAAIRQAFAPAGVSVTAVELPTRLNAGSLYVAQPSLEAFHSKLRLDEGMLLRTAGASLSLGWSITPNDGAPFFLAHGAYGAAIEGGDFFAHWVKARQFGLDVGYEQFSPTAMAARHGRVLFPDEETERFGRTDYGYHLPALAYAGLLKNLAVRLGVNLHKATSITADIDGKSGSIRAVQLDGHHPIEGDLFVDASGAEAVLIGSLHVPVESWPEFFPFDHLATSLSAPISPTPPYAELRLSEGRWTAFRASQGATHLVECSSGPDESNDSGSIRVRAPGIRTMPWSANCVAVGSSACALDPLFDLDLHALHLSLVQLISLFPATSEMAAERGEYNRSTRLHFERLRDSQAALYRLAGLSAEIPETLQQKIDAFGARGTIAPMEDESFLPDQWRALFVGFGLMPDSWPPAIDTVAPEVVKQAFRRTLGFVRGKVLQQPSHANFLAGFPISTTGTALPVEEKLK